MVSTTAVMILANIFQQNGGMTHAVYRRANALADVCSRVVILTYQFHKDFEELLEWHREKGHLNRSVEVLNLFEPKSRTSAPRRAVGFREEWSYFQNPKRSEVFRVFDEEGRYIRYEERNNWGGLNFVDHFESPWVRVRKSVYDSHGTKRRELYMDRDTNSPAFQVTFSNDGRPLVSSKLSKGNPVSFFSHSDGVEFADEIQMAAHWIGRQLRAFSNPLLFIEKREFVKPLEAISVEGMKRVLVLHSSHLDHPFTDPGVVSKSMEDALSAVASGKVSKMVVLTEEQRRDLSVDSRLVDKVVTIPHYQERQARSTAPHEPHSVVSLARYHPAKNIDEALAIISEVRTRVPDVTYRVHGYGPELERLEKKVLDLGLQDNVTLAGHTDEPELALRSAALMLFTSRNEGMGLAPMESLAVGTPVVSLDPKYGPREVVRNDVDGYLIPRETENPISEAAERVADILLDSSLRNRLSEAAMEVSARFSSEDFCDQWRALISDLVSQGEGQGVT